MLHIRAQKQQSVPNTSDLTHSCSIIYDTTCIVYGAIRIIYLAIVLQTLWQP